MHLKITGHTVNFIKYGNYNKNTGMRERKAGKIDLISMIS